MNIDPNSIPSPIPAPSLQLKLFNLNEVEQAEVTQKGAIPSDYISVEWQCPKMTFCGLSGTESQIATAIRKLGRICVGKLNGILMRPIAPNVESIDSTMTSDGNSAALRRRNSR